jgi:hypothetical protein
VQEILNQHWAEMNRDEPPVMDAVGRSGLAPLPH